MSSWWTGTRLVAVRAITENVRSRTFKVVTAVLLLLSAAAVSVPQLLGEDAATYTVATVGEPPADLVAALDAAAQAAGVEAEYLPRTNEDAVRRAVDDGRAQFGLAGPVLFTTSQVDTAAAALVSQAVTAVEVQRRLEAAGLSPQQVAELQSVRPPEQVVVGAAQDVDRAGAGFLVGVVLYLAVMFAGTTIATSVAVEKSTRISEVLLAVLRPSQVMVGTVLAVGAVTLGQLLVLATPLVVGVRVTDSIGLPAAAGADIALGVVWFVLGFLTYAFVFAAAGALVNKMNEVNTTVVPISMVLIAAYLLGILVSTEDAESTVSVVASMFPLSAPLVMPIRWAGGQVPPWQLVVAMLLTAATAALLALFASTVYRRALLITGRRAKLREVVRPRAAG